MQPDSKPMPTKEERQGMTLRERLGLTPPAPLRERMGERPFMPTIPNRSPRPRLRRYN